MLAIENTIVSLDVITEEFICNIEKCRGLCCLYGDAGAPLDESELDEIENNYEAFKPYMVPEGIEAVDRKGLFEVDRDNDLVTPLIDNRECAYAYVEDDIYKCAIEKAWFEGKSTFRKPVSCHLYPIRIKKLREYEAVNYDRWDICKSACRLGKENKVPVYVFLKEPLIRKYGQEWYNQLQYAAENLEIDY
jgi:hypothetical protein